MFTRIVIATAAIGLSVASASAAKWETRQIHQGGGRTTTVVVRSHAEKPATAPYALTGKQEPKKTKRVVQRWAGPHYIGPVLEFAR